jgi:hypothetical protein
MSRVVWFLALVVTCVSLVVAQTPRFAFPVTVSDDSTTQIVYLGVSPTAVYCIVESDSVSGHAEFFLPPVPPAGVFDARVVWPRSGSNLICFDQGSWTDIRPYTVSSQRDTFRVKSQLGQGARMIYSWPANVPFTQATLRYFDQNLGQNVNVDMRTNTSANVTDAGDPATVNFYMQGPLTSVEPISNGIPDAFALSQNYPNPFNPTTSFTFALPEASETEISVYGILGEKVATLTAGQMNAGNYTATWDGKNSAGISVSSGVYIVQMSARGESGKSFAAMRKLVLMR